jgi:hypothetical protein
MKLTKGMESSVSADIVVLQLLYYFIGTKNLFNFLIRILLLLNCRLTCFIFLFLNFYRVYTIYHPHTLLPYMGWGISV